MSSTAIDFPKDRSELDPAVNPGLPDPATGPLQDGDIFIVSGSSYTWAQDAGESYGRWRNEDPGQTSDERYVLKQPSSDQVINGAFELSINDEITLDGNDGSATFSGDVAVENGATIYALNSNILSQPVPDSTREGYSLTNGPNNDGAVAFRLNYHYLSAVSPFAISIVNPPAGTQNTLCEFTNNGDFLIGGSLPAEPNISLKGAGSATFAGNIDVNGGVNAGTGPTLFADGRIYGKTVYAYGGGGSGLLFQGTESGVEKFKVDTSGSAIFQGSLDVQGGNVYKLGNSGIGFGGNTLFGVNTAGNIAAGINLGSSSTPFGTATFSGTVTAGATSTTTDTGSYLQSIGGVYTTRPAGSSDALFAGYRADGSGTVMAYINADGTINGRSYVQGGIAAGPGTAQDYGILGFANSTSSNACAVYGRNYAAGGYNWYGAFGATGAVTSYITEGGAAWFAAGATLRNVTIELEPDNDANYTVTTGLDVEGNTVENRVYNGPTLDVKAMLQNHQARCEHNDAIIASLQARIQTLEANIMPSPTPQPTPAPTPQPTPTPAPTNLIPDEWSHIDKLKALKELISEMNL